MKMKLSTIAISFLLMMSGFFVVVSGADTGVSVEEDEPEPIEIHDWHDLDEVREKYLFLEDYILMNDLDEDTDGYDEYNKYTKDYTVNEEKRGFYGTWDQGDTIDIHFSEDYHYESISVENRTGTAIEHTVRDNAITIEEDTEEKYVFVTYKNARIGWEPIGSWKWPYMGVFDGNGYEINDLYINRPGEEYVGLFGYVRDGGVTDVSLFDAYVIGSSEVGSLIGENADSTVKNSFATGEVVGDGNVGGLVGHLGGNEGGTIDTSYATSEVNGDNNVGGLVGDNDGTVSNSYATSNVSGNRRVGGLVGRNRDTIIDSYTTGDVNGSRRIGGLVGSNDGTVKSSYSTGDVTGNSKVGGVVGNYGGSLNNSYYNIDEVLINGEHHITRNGLFGEQYQDWIDDMELDIEDYSDTLKPSGDIYEISSVEGFRDLLGFAHDGEYKFRLTEDIDFSGESGLYIPYLAADFDGDGNTVSNLNIDMQFGGNIGLFGHASGVNISDISVVDAEVTGYNRVGGLVGRFVGTAENSYATGTVNGNEYVGGFAGTSGGTVTNSYATGDVSGDEYVGGFAGISGGTVTNSYATGDVSGNKSVGGFAGFNTGRNSRSYATGNVSGNESVGGFVGRNWGTITMNHTYATGTVIGNKNVGGLVGMNWRDPWTPTPPGPKVFNSYSTGEVIGEEYVGGLVGNHTGGTVENSYWDIEKSGMEKSDGGTGLMTDEMIGENATVNMDGFDFDDIWETVLEDDEDAIEKGYPILQELDREDQLKAQSVYPEEDDDDNGIPGFTMPLLALAVVVALLVYYKKRW